MPDGTDGVTIKVLGGISEIAPAQWDACAGPDPLVGHAFLDALERSGSACPETGWAPCHLVVEDRDGRALACAPLYLKSHSFGEYVFDWSWADAYRRAGGRYYPKLQCAVPFTPVTGRRLLVRPEAPEREMQRLLTAGMLELARLNKVSSLHITFPTGQECRRLEEFGLLPRLGQQYHWENRGYRDFADFLETLSSRKRKAIRKERERAAASGLGVRTLTGAEIRPRHWDAFHGFYLDTTSRKWGEPYLTRNFFHLLGERLAERIALVIAERDGRPVAGALNLIGDGVLYGRNWGAVETHPFLHFECCYYRAIDFAIERGLGRVEAGAQGEHKVQRGYLPQPTYSAHWIADEGFRGVVARFLEHERAMVAEDMAEMAAEGPYRKG